MNRTSSIVRCVARTRICLAAAAIAFGVGEATAFQDENPKSAAPPIDYKALELPPQGAIRLDKYLQGVPEAQRPAKQWKFYERDIDGDGWLSEEEAANDNPAKVSPLVQRFRALDVNADGFLSRTEYVEPADSKLEGEAKTAFAKAATLEFALFDHNEDGRLSFDEFCYTPRLNLAATPKFRRLDADHN